VKKHFNNIIKLLNEEGETYSWSTVTYDGILDLLTRNTTKKEFNDLKKLVSDVRFELEKLGYETSTDMKYGLRIDVKKIIQL
jgi:hypothetical protein